MVDTPGFLALMDARRSKRWQITRVDTCKKKDAGNGTEINDNEGTMSNQERVDTPGSDGEPVMEWVLPLPVMPYANMHVLKP